MTANANVVAFPQQRRIDAFCDDARAVFKDVLALTEVCASYFDSGACRAVKRGDEKVALANSALEMRLTTYLLELYGATSRIRDWLEDVANYRDVIEKIEKCCRLDQPDWPKTRGLVSVHLWELVERANALGARVNQVVARFEPIGRELDEKS